MQRWESVQIRVQEVLCRHVHNPPSTSSYNHHSNGEAAKSVARVKGLIKKVAHAKGDFNVAFPRDSPRTNLKMSPARPMFRRTLRFPRLTILPDNGAEVVTGEEKQARKVVDEKRGTRRCQSLVKRWWSLRKGCTSFYRTTRPSCLTLESRSSDCVRAA